MARFPQSDKTTVDLSEILSGQGSTENSNSANSNLGKLLQHAALLTQLHQLLAASLDPGLAAHFQVANIRQDRLVLLASSPAWATACACRPRTSWRSRSAAVTRTRRSRVRDRRSERRRQNRQESAVTGGQNKPSRSWPLAGERVRGRSGPFSRLTLNQAVAWAGCA
jgi:hypothetical protein